MSKSTCMFCLPPELTGHRFDVCGLFRDACNHLEHDCVAYKRHNNESRTALASAIEEKAKEKVVPLSEPWMEGAEKESGGGDGRD